MAGLTPPTIDERSTLLEFLRQQRYVLRVATFGLDDEQARATPSASALSVGGIVKHVALTERHWMQRIVAGRELDTPPDTEDGDDFRVLPDETLAYWLAFYDDVAAETERIIADSDLGRLVPIPKGVPWFPQDQEYWSLRWVVLHVIEETARHAGHADIVRESLDGAAGFQLLADYETAQGKRPDWADYLSA